MNIKDTVCRYAWDYPIMSFNRAGLRMCCRAAPNAVQPNHIEQHGTKLFSEFKPIVDMRRDLLTGKKTQACKSCWKIEDGGGVSPRTDFNALVHFAANNNLFGTTDRDEIIRRWENLTEDEVEKIARGDYPRMIEISLSNVCDLKCMYCNHHYSSQWGAEMLKYKEIPIHRIEEEFPKPNPEYEALFWQWFSEGAFKRITSINFIGGEPLLIDEFYESMDRILTLYEQHPTEVPKTVTFSVVSNFNTPPKQFARFLAFLDRVFAIPGMQFDLIVSAETFGDRAQFIRSGCSWLTVDTNIRKFLRAVQDRSAIQCKFGFIPSHNTLSVSTLPEFVHYAWLLHKRYKRDIHLRVNQIVYPSWMAPTLLPAEYICYVDEAIEFLNQHVVDEVNMIPAGRWSTFRGSLMSLRRLIDKPDAEKDHHARREFKTQVLKLASRRGLNLYGTFPEMRPFFNMIEVLP
jgi:hypothetical protein